jgi:hypothetical protein
VFNKRNVKYYSGFQLKLDAAMIIEIKKEKKKERAATA